MRSCTKESVNNEKVQKFVPVLDENLSVKSSPKLFAKYLEDKIFKTKIIQNISVTLGIFLTIMCVKWVPGDSNTIFLATRKLRFYVNLHFNARKHMILSFYLTWTEFKRNYEFVPI